MDNFIRKTHILHIQINGEDFEYFEGFCEHSDIDKLPTERVAGGSNVIESDTGDWYFFVESTKTWSKRTTIAG